VRAGQKVRLGAGINPDVAPETKQSPYTTGRMIVVHLQSSLTLDPTNRTYSVLDRQQIVIVGRSYAVSLAKMALTELCLLYAGMSCVPFTKFQVYSIPMCGSP
jgi:hypothetical protein